MRRLTLALLAACLLTVNVPEARAQVVEDDALGDSVSVELPSNGEVTPEMWLYLQETKRHEDPKQAVRRKAEMRAAQRQARLAAQRWFGVSNLRPAANPVPYYGSYSPSWVGSARNPYSWHGTGHPYVTFHRTTRR